MQTFLLIMREFMKGLCTPSQMHYDRKIRDSLMEDHLDKMISDSFPSSDPPSTY